MLWRFEKRCVTIQERVTRVIAENVKTTRVPNWLMPQHLTLRQSKFIPTIYKSHFQTKRKQNFLYIQEQKTKTKTGKEEER